MADVNVWVYPNTSDEVEIARAANAAIEDALIETVNSTRINSQSVEVIYDYPNVNDPDRETFKSNFEDWTWLNASGNGCHLGVSSNFTAGLADTGEYDENGFFEETEAVVGSSSGVTDFFKNLAIQETYHTFIDKGLNGVSKHTGPDNNEHSLGQVNGSNEASPMVTSYVDDGLAGKGTCDGTDSVYGYFQSPTYCTNRSMEVSYDQHG